MQTGDEGLYIEETQVERECMMDNEKRKDVIDSLCGVIVIAVTISVICVVMIAEGVWTR